MKSDKIKIFLLYFFLTAGGMWHLLGLFQREMVILAPVMIALIAILLVYEVEKRSGSKSIIKSNIMTWLLIFSFGWLIEYIGVNTGLIFGEYFYTEILYPKLLGVPIVIGFAWVSTLIGAYSIVERLPIFRTENKSIIAKALAIGFFMLLFDIVMEYAILKLGYWVWIGGTIPIMNYAAWFVFGFLFSLLVLALSKKHKVVLPSIAFHSYIAQLIYFLLVLVS